MYKNHHQPIQRTNEYLYIQVVGATQRPAARHHGRTCTDMNIIVVGAAFSHIFDQQVTRKALILDIGVCIMEEK